MDPFATFHFSDDALLLDAKSLAGLSSHTTAKLLTRIAEIGHRKLFLREGYSSLRAYCVRELGLCDESAEKRITAAHIIKRFPGVLVALSDGRLHLTAVLMLGRHLTTENADELVAAAENKTRFEIAQELVRRFPRPDLPEHLQPIPPPAVPVAPVPMNPPAPEQVQSAIRDWLEGRAESPSLPGSQPASERVQVATVGCLPAPERVEPPAPKSKVMPLSADRFGLQVTVDRETHELLQQARSLMSHKVPSGELALVLKGVLQLAVAELEKRKFAATSRPGHSRGCKSARHIPAAVKRAVRERDGDRCAFVSESGTRCESRTRLEFHHVNTVARGGRATVENIRLLCAAHNQHEARREFGAEFMDRKWPEARGHVKGH